MPEAGSYSQKSFRDEVDPEDPVPIYPLEPILNPTANTLASPPIWLLSNLSKPTVAVLLVESPWLKCGRTLVSDRISLGPPPPLSLL